MSGMVRPPGFGPGLGAWGAERKDVLSAYKSFCEIDLNLSEQTTYKHINRMKRFFRIINKPIGKITRDDIRQYLRRYKKKARSTYANEIKSLRRFFRDYLRQSHLIDTFKLPSRTYEPKILPTKDELIRFYRALANRRDRALFLLFASSGLRKGEVLHLTKDHIDIEARIILPQQHQGTTKRAWVSFFNDEAADALVTYLSERTNDADKVFPLSQYTNMKTWRKAVKHTHVKVTPQVLRRWFCSEMGRLGVPDRYVDAFCGRTPKSILAKHYTDYSPEKLKEISFASPSGC
jgi:integrase